MTLVMLSGRAGIPVIRPVGIARGSLGRVFCDSKHLPKNIDPSKTYFIEAIFASPAKILRIRFIWGLSCGHFGVFSKIPFYGQYIMTQWIFLQLLHHCIMAIVISFEKERG